MFKSLLARAREIRAAELEGESGSEGGFTLIELMVVLLIIAILLAIAIPTFLSVSGGARDRAAQSNLTNGLTDSIAYYQNSQSYDANSDAAGATLCSQNAANVGCAGGDTDTPTAMNSAEPSFSWVNGATDCKASANSSKCVSIVPADAASTNDGQGVIVAAYSATGTCWYALNMQATPVLAAAKAATTGVFAGQAAIPATAATAGTFYAKVTSAATCKASNAQAFASWGSSYSNAPLS